MINDTSGGGAPLYDPNAGSTDVGGDSGNSTGSGDGDNTDEFAPTLQGEMRLTSGRGRQKKTIGFELEFTTTLDVGVAQEVLNYRVTQAGFHKNSPRKVIRVKSATVRDGDLVDLRRVSPRFLRKYTLSLP